MNTVNVPDITMIIPTYNRSRLLRQAIDSCLAQNGVSVEVLVVDDASTDDTQAVLSEYAPQVRNILLDENHGNGCFARNAGIKNAQGQYIKFLDHDDVLEPDTLVRELAAARAANADMVMSGWGWCDIDEDGNVIPGSQRMFEPPLPEELIEAILGDRKVPFTAAVLYRRAYIIDMEWDSSARVRDDFDWFCRTSLKGGKIIVSPGNSYWWRYNRHSISAKRSGDDLSFLEIAYVMNRILTKIERLLKEKGLLTASRKEKLAHQYYSTGLRAFSRYDYTKFKDVLAHIFELCPGFHPTLRSEYNRYIRFLCGIIGVKAALMLYAVIRRSTDLVSPPKGNYNHQTA
jgi:glycosyltransferase involved in cell wall biosynthesis